MLAQVLASVLCSTAKPLLPLSAAVFQSNLGIPLSKAAVKEIKEMDEFVESLNDYNNNNNEMHSFISGKYPNNINITVYVESRKFLAPSPITKTDETSRCRNSSSCF